MQDVIEAVQTIIIVLCRLFSGNKTDISYNHLKTRPRKKYFIPNKHTNYCFFIKINSATNIFQTGNFI